MLGYAKATNKPENRTGSLLQKGFRRKYIPDNEYDKKHVLFYVHHNPIHHFYTDNYKDYLWNSYNTFLPGVQTRICREEVLSWFGGREQFADFGKKFKHNKMNDDLWIIDED